VIAAIEGGRGLNDGVACLLADRWLVLCHANERLRDRYSDGPQTAELPYYKPS
jgi:hypothetical protein